MMAAQVAIILLVNGLQIALPQPAFVEDGHAWLPGRAVFSACGFTVDWDTANSALVCVRGQRKLEVWRARRHVRLNGAAIAIEQAPRMVDGALFLPSEVLKLALGGGMSWDGASKSLSIECREEASVAVTVEELQGHPFRYVDRPVRVTGEYWGSGDWPGAESHDVWVLRGRNATIGCRSSVGGGIATDMPRLVYGQRVIVDGVCNMYKNGSLYIDIIQLGSASGADRLTCVLETDREEYGPSEPIIVEVEVSNHTPDLIVCELLTVQICDARGQVVWSRKLDVPAELPPNWTENLHFALTGKCPIGLNGVYSLRLVSGGGEWAHQRCFAVRASL